MDEDEWWVDALELDGDTEPVNPDEVAITADSTDLEIAGANRLPGLPQVFMPPNITQEWVRSQVDLTQWPAGSALNPALIVELCKYARKGLSKRGMMARVGLAVNTWYAWEAKAREGLEPYATCMRAVSYSASQVEEELLDKVKMGADTDWKAAKWLLEMGNREEYGSGDKGGTQVTINNGDVTNNTASVNYVTQDDALEIATLLEGIGALKKSNHPVLEGEVLDDDDTN